MIYFIIYFYPDPHTKSDAWNIALLNNEIELSELRFYGRINRDYKKDPTNYWFHKFGESAKKGMIYQFKIKTISKASDSGVEFTLIG